MKAKVQGHKGAVYLTPTNNGNNQAYQPGSTSSFFTLNAYPVCTAKSVCRHYMGLTCFFDNGGGTNLTAGMATKNGKIGWTCGDQQGTVQIDNSTLIDPKGKHGTQKGSYLAITAFSCSGCEPLKKKVKGCTLQST